MQKYKLVAHRHERAWKTAKELYDRHVQRVVRQIVVRLRELYEKYIADEETITRQTGR